MKNNDGLKVLAGVLLVLGILIIIGSASSKNDYRNTSIECGCDNDRAYGSSYCYIHKPYTSTGTTSSYRSGSNTSSTGKTGSSSSQSSTTNSHSSYSSHSSHSSGYSTTYNTLMNDPADYDDPEEYADDAWGEDFEDWDDAYDYWEDY